MMPWMSRMSVAWVDQAGGFSGFTCLWEGGGMQEACHGIFSL